MYSIGIPIIQQIVFQFICILQVIRTHSPSTSFTFRGCYKMYPMVLIHICLYYMCCCCSNKVYYYYKKKFIIVIVLK